MPPSSCKQSLANYLTQAPQGLQQVMRKAKELQLLQKTILSTLEPSWQKDCDIANLRDGCLVLITTNATIATQITFKAPELLKQLRANTTLPLIKEIRCKVRPFNTPSPTKTSKNTALLSTETAHLIKKMAETIEDKKLQEVMQRIATRVKK